MNASILLWCDEKVGIERAVDGFIYDLGGSIKETKSAVDVVDETTDPKKEIFLLRKEFLLNKDIGVPELAKLFSKVAEELKVGYNLESSHEKKRLAIYAGDEDHCLQEILWRAERGDINGTVELVISDKTNLERIANRYDILFVHSPKIKDIRRAAELDEERILNEHKIDLIGAAKYMWKFTPEFVENWRWRMINVHHSTLPSFKGKNALIEAHAHGVKEIGATSHYITPELDEGPIIDVRTVRVTYTDGSSEKFRKKLENPEREAFYNAIKLHLENRVPIYKVRWKEDGKVFEKYKTNPLTDVV